MKPEESTVMDKSVKTIWFIWMNQFLLFFQFLIYSFEISFFRKEVSIETHTSFMETRMKHTKCNYQFTFQLIC